MNFIIGNKYKLTKPNGKIKIIKLNTILSDANMLYFTFIKKKLFKTKVIDLIIKFDKNENYYLKNKLVKIEEIPEKVQNIIIEQYNYINNLSEQIKDSIIEYTTNKYTEINKYLDNNQLPFDKNLNDIISNIDIAFKNAPPLKEDIILFRGLNLPEIIDKRRNKNMPLMGYKGTYKGFLSTSLQKFNTEMFKSKTCCTFEINIPKNTKCLFIELISNVPTEQEVLIQRNSIISIVSFNENNIIKSELISLNKI